MKLFLEYDFIKTSLTKGCEIFTERGNAPYKPLHYLLWDGERRLGYIHHGTIKRLIKDGVINGTDSAHDKYKLITHA